MKTSGKLTIAAQGDRELTMTCGFDAPRHMVFDAYTKPELVRRWLGVHSGWHLAVCEIDLKVGGKYRYVWRKESKGIEMGVGGVYLEIVRPERLVCTEKFDDSWYSGESLLTTIFAEDGGATTLTITARYESQEARDGVLRSPMESGVAESFDRLADLLASTT